MAGYPRLRDGTLRLLGCPNDHAAVSAEIARRDGEDLEQAFIESRLTGALIRASEDWAQLPQGKLLAERPVVEIERIGDSAAEPLGPGSRPLSGVRVADMTHVVAGPLISRCLAEQGADVLHLGRPIRAGRPDRAHDRDRDGKALRHHRLRSE